MGTKELLASLITASLIAAYGVHAAATTLSVPNSIQAIKMETRTTGEVEGSIYNIYSNGYIANGFNFPADGSYQFQVSAYGSSAGGIYPKMELRVDGKVIGSFPSVPRTMAAYTASADISAGVHQVAIAFTNDYVSRRADRNLYASSMQISSATPAPAPAPAPPPAPAPAPAPTPAASNLTEIIDQNTRGSGTLDRPYGVPTDYGWYDGKNGCTGSSCTSPAGFTSITGWGQVYPIAGKPVGAGKVYLSNFQTYVHLKTGSWVKVQDSADDTIAGAHYVADFSNNASYSWTQQNLSDGTAVVDAPVAGYNDHFYYIRRGVYAADSVDGVFVTCTARTDNAGVNVVVNIGADWWRDASAPYLYQDGVFVNNPGVGMSNWVTLSTTPKQLYYTTYTATMVQTLPLPGL